MFCSVFLHLDTKLIQFFLLNQNNHRKNSKASENLLFSPTPTPLTDHGNCELIIMIYIFGLISWYMSFRCHLTCNLTCKTCNFMFKQWFGYRGKCNGLQFKFRKWLIPNYHSCGSRTNQDNYVYEKKLSLVTKIP